MSVRRLFAGVSTAAVVAASLSLAAPALADPAAGYTPAASDVIGVGSDTSEFALNFLADGNAGTPGYNASSPANKLVSWNALPPAGGTATINLPSNPTAPRPNGSTAGKNALYGAGNVADIDFARSSSALSTTEKQAGLQAFPFAKDSLALATAKVSNAPTSISPADMVRIYSGTVTNWSQLGGAPGVIEPKIPQAGSGTRVVLRRPAPGGQQRQRRHPCRHGRRGAGARPQPDPEQPERSRAVLHRPQRGRRRPAADRGRLHGSPGALQRRAPG